MNVEETTPSVAEIGSHPRVIPKRKLGSEHLTDNGTPIGVELSDFWGWSASDLIDNITRGKLAEFIVARALGISTAEVRDSWAAWDLTIPEPPIRVEVKSAAYLQSWFQKRYSSITFATPRTLAWDSETGRSESVARRQADVYVFALLAHKDLATLDPLDVSQWRFFVLPTATLDERARSQHSITITTLKTLAAELRYAELDSAVRHAANKGLEFRLSP